MATGGDKPKIGERICYVIRRVLAFVFEISNKRGEVLDCQLYHADGLKLSAQEFYAEVEKQIAARNTPGLEISRVHFHEGGLLSEQRVYLRLMRERLCIDTCAAPFGNIFFFSIRTVHVPALVRLWHLVAAFLFFGLVNGVLLRPLGAEFATVATVTLLVALVMVMHNAAREGGSDLDTALLKIPVLATIYEDWFRVDTYYREDTRSLYLSLFPGFVKEMAEEACAAKGFKLVADLQPPPPVSELNKPVPPDKGPAAS